MSKRYDSSLSKAMRNWSIGNKILGLGLLGLLLLLAANVISVMLQPGDEQQLKNALEEMRQATIENRAGGVMEHLSDAFETPVGINEDSFNPLGQVREFIMRASVTRFVISDVEPTVENQLAVVRCTMDADVEFMSVRYRLQGPVTIEFRKETAYRLFIIPEKKWRVVRFYPVDMSQFSAEPRA